MEKRMLVVKDLPDCSQDTIENYLEVVCDNGVEEILFYDDRIKHIAMVTMEEDLEDMESCMAKARKRKLEGKIVELVEVAPTGGLLVSDLPSNVTEDTLRYYFENPKSGGEDEGVECCRYYEDLGLAKVVFKDPDVVRRVLAKTDHTPVKSKPKVTVKPYYAEFHEDVLDFLANIVSDDSSEGGDNSSTHDGLIRDDAEFSPSSFQNSGMVSLKLAQSHPLMAQEDCSMKSVSGPTERKRTEDDTMVSVCGPPAGNVSTEGHFGENDSLWQREFQRHAVIPEPQLCVESKQTHAPPKVPPKPKPKPKPATMNMQEPMYESIGKETVKLPPANVRQLEASHKIDKEFPKCELAYDSNSGEIMVTGPQSMLQPVQIRLYQEIVEMSNPTHPGPQMMPQPEPEVKERTVKDTVTLCTASVSLLESSGKIDKEFPKCQITYNSGPGLVTIEGPEMKIQELKLRLYEENHKISRATHQVQQTIADIMKTEKGKTLMAKELKGNGNTVWYLDGNNVQCVSFSEAETNSMVESVKRLIQQEYVSYNNSHYHYLKTSEWTELTRTLEKDQMVKIVSERDNHKIRIDGLDQDVDVSKQQIEKELKGHSHKAGTYSLSGAKAKSIKGCFAQDLADVKKIISDGGGHWDDTGSMNSLNLKFDGDPNAVKKAESALKDLEKKVWYERLLLGKDVAKEKDLNLLIRGLHRSTLNSVQAAFEAQHQVFLEINIPRGKKQDVASAASPDQADTSWRLSRRRSLEDVAYDSIPEDLQIFETFKSFRSPRRYSPPRHYSPPRMPLSTSITFGNIKVFIKKGDISKEKADVLVNVVPKNWDITGTTVAQAFAKAGGPEYKQQFDFAQANGAPGGIIQTKSCGNQPGKMIYTIAVDKFNPPRSKTELKTIIDSCLKTADSKGYSSLGLTSVGCGRLFKFPEKFVASCLITAVKNNSKLPNLKQVSMVLFDNSTYQTFLNEINPRPQLTSSRTEPYIDAFDQPPAQSHSVTVGSTNITVEQGDITKTKATVLVNVVTSDLDLRLTAVSQAFARAGGASLIQDFEDKKDSPATNNIIVTSGGKLNCKYVYHVILKKWNPAMEKGYRDIVRDCFKLAGGYTTPSIVFPSLGCGQLFKYPGDFVATTLLEEAKSSSIANVTFVIYDRPVLYTFLQELRSFDDNSSGSSDDLSTLRNYAKNSHAGRVPSSDNKTANIVVYGPNKQICNTAKNALSKQLKTDYLHTEIIKNENLTRLTGKTFASLKSMADKNGIWIKFPDPDKKKNKDTAELKLKGEKNSVLFVKSQIQDILMTAITKTIHKPLRASRASRGTKQFLHEMASMSEFYPPPYWTHFHPKNPLKETVSNFFKMITGSSSKPTPRYKLETVNPATFSAIASLVQKTWNASLVGQGQDAAGLGHGGLKVTEIQRLEHPEMYTKYCQKRSVRFMDACRFGNVFPPIQKLPGSKGAPHTTQFASKELQLDVYQEVNEHYFFHGTKPDKLQAILENGLDSRVGNTQAMFGSGVYGAESSTKADQYTDDKKHRSGLGSNLQMVLMRMTLGHPYVCNNKNAPKYRRPPCKDMTHLCENCTQSHEFFHSVLGDGSWLFREFVVYESDLCYPEYIITYQRV